MSAPPSTAFTTAVAAMLPIGTSPEMIAGVSRSAVIVTSSGSRRYFVNRPSSFATQTGATPAVGVTRPNFTATGTGGVAGLVAAAPVPAGAAGGAGAAEGAAQPTVKAASTVMTRHLPAVRVTLSAPLAGALLP